MSGPLFWTIGYLHARFRLTQMDLERRQGEGQLSEILGMQALDGDRGSNFYGLARTAQAEWQTLPPNSPLHQVLLDYAQGVNARITEDEQNGALPFLFKVLVQLGISSKRPLSPFQVGTYSFWAIGSPTQPLAVRNAFRNAVETDICYTILIKMSGIVCSSKEPADKEWKQSHEAD
jgi:acyl-homoserine lactone acylase PvdQ